MNPHIYEELGSLLKYGGLPKGVPYIFPSINRHSSSSDGKTESSVAQAPVIRRLREKHRSSDRSVAGGGVILGGFFTAMFAAIYCYIRVTRTSYGVISTEEAQ
ncbi:hypothetical protein ACSBR1_012371 [Camellia fascicularis]